MANKKTGKSKNSSTGTGKKTARKKKAATPRSAGSAGRAKTTKQAAVAKTTGAVDFVAALTHFDKNDLNKAWQSCCGLHDSPEVRSEQSTDNILFAAYLATSVGKHPIAHDLLDVAVGRGADDITLAFVAGAIELNFNRPELALEHAKHGLSLIAVAGTFASNWLKLDQALPGFYFLAGRANYDLARLEEAAEAFEKYLRRRPNSEQGYLRLATVRKAQGKISEASSAVAEGIKLCKSHRELDKLNALLQNHETISLCMIVKNEEQMLGQCLESVKDVVDEIIIVDTGSEDCTVEIAESYGAKVFHHKWENDFSKHRNQSLEYATSDWILILDADEELLKDDIEKLRQATFQKAYDAISVSVHNKHLRTGEVTSFLPSTRLWRSKLGARYEGIVHNELRLPPNVKILRADIRIIHYGYGLDWEKMKKKIARSKALLLKQLEENPNNAFANFNLAQLIRGEYKHPPKEACEEILKYAGRVVEQTSPTERGQRHLHLMALDQISSAYIHMHEYEKAEEVALRALEYDPNYLDPMFSLGNIYAGQRKMELAKQAYNDYIEAADKYDPGEETTAFILLHGSSQPRACFNLGLVHEELGENKEAEQAFKRIFDYIETFQDVYAHLALVTLRQGKFDESEQHARKRLAQNDDDNNARQLLARACYRQQKYDLARTACRELLQRNSADTIAMELLISVERSAGDDDAALLLIEELLSVEPDNYTALSEKADIFIAQNEPDKALALYHRLNQIKPRDAEIINDMANCHFRLNEFEEAVRYYSEALAISPQLTPALRNLGLTYFKLGESDKAIEKLANYLDYSQEDSDILYLIARLHFDRGNFEDAARYVERCLQLNPTSAELVALLADCYLKQGHLKSALLGYQKALAIDPAFSPAAEMIENIKQAGREDTAAEETEEPVEK